MKASTRAKLQKLQMRFEELEGLLASTEVASQVSKLSELSKEYTQIESLVRLFQTFTETETQLQQAESLKKDSDPDIRQLAEDEIQENKAALSQIEEQINAGLEVSDPKDNLNVFLEIRAGTGGDESALFAYALLRMYHRYADNCGWRLEVLNKRANEIGGYKEVICHISGKNTYGCLKFESGTHRVQRVPETESQGRIHTSACTVAVLPEIAMTEEIQIDRKDLRIDTYRASGAGGQHVNKTDSAVRITHLPTSMVAECQEERSQHKNKERALRLLQAKLTDAAQAADIRERAESRKKLVGSGDRSERIRTYNFPQGRLTDHRIGLTLYKLDDILAGNLDLVIVPLRQEEQAENMSAEV